MYEGLRVKTSPSGVLTDAGTPSASGTRAASRIWPLAAGAGALELPSSPHPADPEAHAVARTWKSPIVSSCCAETPPRTTQPASRGTTARAAATAVAPSRDRVGRPSLTWPERPGARSCARRPGSRRGRRPSQLGAPEDHPVGPGTRRRTRLDAFGFRPRPWKSWTRAVPALLAPIRTTIPRRRAIFAESRRGRIVVSRRRPAGPPAAPGRTVRVPVPARACPFASRAVRVTSYLPGLAPAGIPTATETGFALSVAGTSVAGVTATPAPGRSLVALRRKSAAGVALPA